MLSSPRDTDLRSFPGHSGLCVGLNEGGFEGSRVGCLEKLGGELGLNDGSREGSVEDGTNEGRADGDAVSDGDDDGKTANADGFVDELGMDDGNDDKDLEGKDDVDGIDEG